MVSKEALMPERNPLSRAVQALLSGLIGIYRYALSPWVGRQCRYYPTCSAYAQQALARHGPLKGAFLAARRVCACHPWSARPLTDPVPDQFEWRALMGYKRPNP